MEKNLPKLYFSKILRAIVEFELIERNDAILIGLSGGKDSLFLLYALIVMKKYIKTTFSLKALTIDPMFSDDFDAKSLYCFCKKLDVPYEVIKVNIKEAIEKSRHKSPCFTCSFLRHGAINSYAKKMKCNKVAYAHHHDDAVETFFMSLLYSGQLHTFLPKTYLDRTKLTIIRPLIYLREKEISDAICLHGTTPLPSPCPYNGTTNRQKIKELIANLAKDTPNLYEHLGSAMRKNSIRDLWSEKKSRNQLKDMYNKIMY